MASSSTSSWTMRQNKLFENALAIYDKEETPDRWHKMAMFIGGKTVEEVKLHYEMLIDDVRDIESGQVPLPNYKKSTSGGNNRLYSYMEEQRRLQGLRLQ